MRRTGTCPKCYATRIYVTRARLRIEGCAMELKAAIEMGTNYPKDAGYYQTWICSACGYTEWYAKDDAEKNLQRLSEEPGSGVEVAEAKGAPYR